MMRLIIPALLLFSFGVFNLLGIKGDLIRNELFFVLFAIVAFFVVRKIGRNFISLNSYFFYWLFIIILFITFLLGLEAKGSKRWLDLYFFNFQASEIFKPFFILFLTNFLAKEHKGFNKLYVFLASLFYFILPFFVIYKQPDLGNALIYLIIFFFLVLFSPLPKRYVIYMILVGLIVGPISFTLLRDYQRERIISFLNPSINEQGTSYNMIQSVITTGSGQFFGKGLGLGTQSRLFFLPENHTDFAFASLVEQFGFVGGFTILVLFSVIILALFKKLLKRFFNKDEESLASFLYVVGFTVYIASQTLINIGMNLGVFPVAGIALPFISYGGSALVAIMIGIALLP